MRDAPQDRRDRAPAPTRRAALGLIPFYAVVALVIVSALYGQTLSYGFDYDDYHFVRPYSWQEIRGAFHGPWDPSGIEVAFYRPLTIVLYAARFHFLGVNSAGYHALSLVMFAAATALFGLLVRRFLSSAAAGLLGMMVFASHPSMPYAAVAWITNQMHILQLLVVLGAIAWWWRVADRPAVYWLPLIGFEVAALMVKEDGVMLVPTILVLHLLRSGVRRTGSWRVPLGFVVPAALAGALVLWFRSAALHGIGGYAVPGFDQGWSNITRGFFSVFRLLPAKRPWQPSASWFVTVVPILALALWRRVPPPARFGMCAGLAIGILFDLPFVFVVKAEQMHLVGCGAALLLTSSLAGLYDAVSWRTARAAVVGASVAALVGIVAVTRNITSDFEPFGKIMLATDRLVVGWAAVPLELRTFLARKAAPGAAATLPANPADALDVVAFGFHGPEVTPDGRPMRWMAGPVAELYVTRRARVLTIPLRHERGAFGEAARLRVEVDGELLDEPWLDNGDWKLSSIALRRPTASPLRRMHKVVLRLDHAWVPSQIIPGSRDARVLGLQVGEIGIR